MVFQGAQRDFSIRGPESLAREEKDPQARAADIIALGLVD
jgi:hypothetical protein